MANTGTSSLRGDRDIVYLFAREPLMKLTAYVVDKAIVDIRAAPRRRDWMDDTSGRHAYRCLPLAMANSHGWELRSQAGFEAEWNGGSRPEDVKVFPDEETQFTPMGHFGSGILSFHHKVVFRTPPGYNLWVSGPVNRFKDGLQALSALVETDWMPFTFSMNWKFTRPGARVRFDRGDPYCFFFPVARGVVEQFSPELVDIGNDAELKAQYEYALNRRSFVEALKNLKGHDADEFRYQQWYLKGELPDGSASAPEHQRSLSICPFGGRPEE